MAGSATVFEVVTNQIVALLERGIVPWRRPWHDGRRYIGIGIGWRPLAALEA